MKHAILYIFILFNIFLINKSFANDYKDLTEAIERMCLAPNSEGENYQLDVNGNTSVEISFLGINGSATFSREKWNGIKATIEQSKDYRNCVKSIAPEFIRGFYGNRTKKVISSKNTFNVYGNNKYIDINNGHYKGDTNIYTSHITPEMEDSIFIDNIKTIMSKPYDIAREELFNLLDIYCNHGHSTKKEKSLNRSSHIGKIIMQKYLKENPKYTKIYLNNKLIDIGKCFIKSSSINKDLDVLHDGINSFHASLILWEEIKNLERIAFTKMLLAEAYITTDDILYRKFTKTYDDKYVKKAKKLLISAKLFFKNEEMSEIVRNRVLDKIQFNMSYVQNKIKMYENYDKYHQNHPEIPVANSYSQSNNYIPIRFTK